MDTIVVIPYYNFSNSRHRETALQRTVASLGPQIEMLLVAHNLGPSREILSKFSNLRIIDIPSASIVWQKERFLNLALSSMARYYNYIAWIDADIIFNDNSWQIELRQALETSQLVQLFDRVVDVRPEEDPPIETTGAMKRSVVRFFENGTLDGSYFAKSGISQRLGCAPGFAWGARVETMKRIGFPDIFILGGGDKALLAAAGGHHEIFCRTLALNQHIGKRYREWAQIAFESIQGKIAHLSNTIYHIYQGDYKNRSYSNRHQLLADERFAIEDYLEKNEFGAWQWQRDNEYATRIAKYFEQRGD